MPATEIDEAKSQRIDDLSRTAGNRYSKAGLWEKIRKYAQMVGQEALEKVLIAYYVLEDEDTPLQDKTLIIGCLGYFILPVDIMPDFLPTGLVDDFFILTMALTTVDRYVKDEHVKRAKAKTRDLLGTFQGHTSEFEPIIEPNVVTD